MSSTKRPRPVSSAGSSRRATRPPTIYRKRCIAIAADRTLAKGKKVATMLDVDARRAAQKPETGPPLDFQSHLAALEARGLLLRIDRPINKDTELHPFVRL